MAVYVKILLLILGHSNSRGKLWALFSSASKSDYHGMTSDVEIGIKPHTIQSVILFFPAV